LSFEESAHSLLLEWVRRHVVHAKIAEQMEDANVVADHLSAFDPNEYRDPVLSMDAADLVAVQQSTRSLLYLRTFS
jgi:hypothetical protein